MPRFSPNEPIVSSDPAVELEGLGVGAHRFKLVVVDNDGQESDPAFLDVVIRAGNAPTAVLDLIDENGRRVDLNTIVGTKLFLSGERSSDVEPGRIVEYRFTLLS